jgi:hypothetical protein
VVKVVTLLQQVVVIMPEPPAEQVVAHAEPGALLAGKVELDKSVALVRGHIQEVAQLIPAADKVLRAVAAVI